MDPFTALGVAAATVQFIDFGFQVLSLCKQIRDSADDTTEEQAELERSISRLEDLLKEMGTNVHDRGIVQATERDMIVSARDLKSVLSDIQSIAQTRRLGALRAALRFSKDRKKIDKLQQKLEQCQARYIMAVTSDTRKQVYSLLEDQGKQSKTLKNVMFPKSCQLAGQPSQSTGLYPGVCHGRSTEPSPEGRLSKSTEPPPDILDYTAMHDGFLESLKFSDMFARHRNIESPSPKTFDWIFAEPGTSKRKSTKQADTQGNFVNWLQGSGSHFWINGKAGSGKSSLMSFIEGHKRTRELLRGCAGDRSLHVFSFFFWRAGSDLQRSIPGLLQCLVYQLANRKREAIDRVLSNEPTLQHSAWTSDRLLKAFHHCLEAYEEDCVVLFIDGMDEYQGNYLHLIQTLSDLQSGPNIKLCLSSRRETELWNKFKTCPSIRLEHLNFEDILQFVKHELESRGSALSGLASDIALRAEGIFLWAVLVCRSLVSGYEAQDDAETMRARLDAVPSGLEELFEYMFSKTEAVHRKTLAVYFCILKWQRSMTVEFNMVQLATLMQGESSSFDELHTRCTVEQHRIMAQSKGLIDIHTDEHDKVGALESWALRDISDGSIRSGPVTDVDMLNAMAGHVSTKIQWVHRSAFDCIFGESGRQLAPWILEVDEPQLVREMLVAIQWLLQYAPLDVAGVVGITLKGTLDQIKAFTRMSRGQFVPECHAALNSLTAAFFQSPISEDRRRRHFFELKFFHASLGDFIVASFELWQHHLSRGSLCSDVLSTLASTRPYPAHWRAMALLLGLCFERPVGHSMWIHRSTSVYNATTAKGETSVYSWIGTGSLDDVRVIVKFTEIMLTLYNVSILERREDGVLNSWSSFAARVLTLVEDREIFCGAPVVHMNHLLPLQILLPPSHGVFHHVRRDGIPLPESYRWDKAVLRFICLGDLEEGQGLGDELLPVQAHFDLSADGSKELMRFLPTPLRGDNRMKFAGVSKARSRCQDIVLNEIWKNDGSRLDNRSQRCVAECVQKWFEFYWS